MGEMHALVRGEVAAVVTMGNMHEISDDSPDEKPAPRIEDKGEV